MNKPLLIIKIDGPMSDDDFEKFKKNLKRTKKFIEIMLCTSPEMTLVHDKNVKVTKL